MSQQMLFYRGASVLLITRERQKPSRAYTSSPTKGELLIKVMAVAVQPTEYKIQKGILPFQLTYHKLCVGNPSLSSPDEECSM